MRSGEASDDTPRPLNSGDSGAAVVLLIGWRRPTVDRAVSTSGLDGGVAAAVQKAVEDGSSPHATADDSPALGSRCGVRGGTGTTTVSTSGETWA